VVLHCKGGVRSARAARLLAQRGFRDVWSMAGGIEAWSLTVDPRVPRG
jgi:adenylyltransferase/sulfurtransferase